MAFSLSVGTGINPALFAFSQGHHYNWTREDCDKSLLGDMLRSCHTHNRRRRGITDALLDIWYFFQGINKEERRCKIAAEMYYKIVRAFGGSHFEKRDHEYCTSTCADKHGSPYKDLYWVTSFASDGMIQNEVESLTLTSLRTIHRILKQACLPYAKSEQASSFKLKSAAECCYIVQPHGSFLQVRRI